MPIVVTISEERAEAERLVETLVARHDVLRSSGWIAVRPQHYHSLQPNRSHTAIVRTAGTIPRPLRGAMREFFGPPIELYFPGPFPGLPEDGYWWYHVRDGVATGLFMVVSASTGEVFSAPSSKCEMSFGASYTLSRVRSAGRTLGEMIQGTRAFSFPLETDGLPPFPDMPVSTIE